ncbi:MAG TPA: ABC transporter substrate-binding protein [Propionibacteriaceae bacterium]|nr:ABC transporter substrate-binding protein [Propionibacteriaceae bacterium]
MTHPRPRWRRAAVALVAVLLTASGCVTTADVIPSPTSASPSPHDFTVATTERPTALDPVAVTDSMSTSLVSALFQRLLTLDEGKTALHPDAATDCIFVSPLQYRCKIKPNLKFSNGHALTSSDVRFSIARALRLGVAGSSARQLEALSTMDTPDPTTIDFNLSWPDNQFGYALAEPAASIVDEDVYDPDAIRSASDLPVGSGPYWISASFQDKLYLRAQTGYVGYTPPLSDFIVLKFYPDSGSLEDAMKTGQVDVVWRGLSAAALKRLDGQISASKDKLTDSGFRRLTAAGQRVHLLLWSATSAYRLDASLRTAISAALQDDRTLDSVIPRGVEGHITAFKLGGVASIPPLTGERPRLTLSYASQITGEAEMARTIRDRIEASVGVSVQVVADTPTADLVLSNYKAWNVTPIAWLQPYRTAALPGSADKIASLEKLYRSTQDQATRDSALSELQAQAAVDAIVLPISQEDDDMFVASAVKTREPLYGPGYQLGLWSLGLS